MRIYHFEWVLKIWSCTKYPFDERRLRTKITDSSLWKNNATYLPIVKLFGNMTVKHGQKTGFLIWSFQCFFSMSEEQNENGNRKVWVYCVKLHAAREWSCRERVTRSGAFSSTHADCQSGAGGKIFEEISSSAKERHLLFQPSFLVESRAGEGEDLKCSAHVFCVLSQSLLVWWDAERRKLHSTQTRINLHTTSQVRTWHFLRDQLQLLRNCDDLHCLVFWLFSQFVAIPGRNSFYRAMDVAKQIYKWQGFQH